MENALREWREETGLEPRYLAFYEGVVLADSQYGGHYFVAEWTKPVEANQMTSWRPPAEDPSDPNPILTAQWLPLPVLLQHQDLSFVRKLLLKRASQLAAFLPFPAVQ